MIKKLFKDKNTVIAFAGAICGILLLLIGVFGNSDKETSDVSVTEYDSEALRSYTEALEQKIENFLEHIGGVNDVEVILTIESSSETVYATEGSNSDYVIIKDSSGNENALQLTEITATIRGIAIVCDYGNDEELRKTIIKTLASLFDIGTNRISVVSA